MIFDRLENLSRYRGLYRGLDTVICWLEQNDPAGLPLGRTELDGDRVFVNVMEADTRSPQQAQYEVHEKYMDLQLDLEGSEAFQLPRGSYVLPPVDPDADVAFLEAECGCQGRLGGGYFALFPAREPHMPTLHGEKPQRVKKAVFKLLRNEMYPAE